MEMGLIMYGAGPDLYAYIGTHSPDSFMLATLGFPHSRVTESLLLLHPKFRFHKPAFLVGVLPQLPRPGRVAEISRLRSLMMFAMGTVTLAGTAHDVPFPTALHSSGNLTLPVALKEFLCILRSAIPFPKDPSATGKGTHVCSRSMPSHDHS